MSGNLVEDVLKDLQIQINEDAEKLLEPYREDYDEYSVKFLKLLLSVDLSKIIKRGSLPLEIHSMHKVNIKGVHLLQLLEAEDVSKAKYKNRFYFNSDLAKMNGISITPPSKNRMMKLIFTDGTNVCSAMEFRYLPELDEFIKFWCQYRGDIENNAPSDTKDNSAHILVFLSGEPEIKRGVILLLPGMLTFIMHKDAEKKLNYQVKDYNENIGGKPIGGSSSSILSAKPSRKQIKASQENLDIRSYSNFVISNTNSKEKKDDQASKENYEIISDQKIQKFNSDFFFSSSLKEDELLLQKLEIKDECFDQPADSNSDSSSVVEVISKYIEDKDNEILDNGTVSGLQDFDYFDSFDNYADVEIREDLECQDENYGDLNSIYSKVNYNSDFNATKPLPALQAHSEFVDDLDLPQNELVIWVEAAVLNSKRSQDNDEIFLELGIHYPAPLPKPWNELLLRDVCLTRKVAEKILSIENVEKSSEELNPNLSMDDLLLYVRFIQGNMCLNVSFDSNNKDLIRANLIGFVPT
ncbi:uncharacterized protein cubi_03213 [Cryptosporidium ubiquitum]|uniref:RecQ mediated genome instability protein 1 OB-fold domain-containing protein n=1 Tax=Cryptosporidium ubiquitum TaxID=857276 RepID=A0A1J4MQM3_9CRYT|nr:uncharacterized protein cubi_03213 [Cryptosporidium ubiquitum]OII75197.1 hypothetical protein cubi_03213 [Cryptosporidium ubiquitum]